MLQEVYLHIDYEHVVIMVIIENIISSKAIFTPNEKNLGLLRFL